MAEEPSNEGWSNLHYAVAGRFTNLVLSLLEQKGEEMVNLPDRQGRTPLHLLCYGIKVADVLPVPPDSEYLTCTKLRDTEKIIEVLLSHGADPQLLDSNGKSPLHCLVDLWLEKQYPVKEIENIITLFLYCRSSINVKDRNGRTLLHHLSGFPKMEVQEVLVRNELVFPTRQREPEVDNSAKCTPEQKHFCKTFVVKLLSCGADLNVADNEGNTPLHFAVAANKFEIVKELLKGKSNLNVRNVMGQTPLHLAVSDSMKFNRCAFTLLDNGTLASIRDRNGKTPVDIARHHSYFMYFMKHLILLINVKMLPEMDVCTGRRNKPDKAEITKCMQECTDLNSYFELDGKSQLPVLLQYHSLPDYTKDDFFQAKITCGNFKRRFPIYCNILERKFLQDQKRREMLDMCLGVFSYCGGSFHYTSAGRLVYNTRSYWESMPVEIKVKILSYLSNSELEYLKDL